MSVLSLLIITGQTIAAESTVKITSFKYAANQTRTSELCGKVENMISDVEMVRVIVDPKAKSPGIYNVIVGKEKTFCVSVVTWTGFAEVEMMNTSGDSTDSTITRISQ